MWGVAAVYADHTAVCMVAAIPATTITSRQAINYRAEENLLATYSVNLTMNGLAQCPLAQNIMTDMLLAFIGQDPCFVHMIPIKTDDVWVSYCLSSYVLQTLTPFNR
jgi:hypothetical protein